MATITQYALDAALKHSVVQAAYPSHVLYTERQLYYELCRTLRPFAGLKQEQAAISFALGMLPAMLAYRTPQRAAQLALANMVITGSLWLNRTIPYVRTPPLSYARFSELLRTYRETHGQPQGLLVPEVPPRFGATANMPDMGAYGVACVLICQDQSIKQMLLANRLHMELSCIVLDVEEALPLPSIVYDMLDRTADARVCVLHDASAAGLSLVTQLLEQMITPPHVVVRAIGLRPDHARQLHLFAMRNPNWSSQLHWPTYLSTRERRWLEAGWAAEVAALRPVQLLRALRRILLDLTPPPLRLPALHRDRDVGFMTWPSTPTTT
ncbi:MAG: hypothetical protein AAGF95_33700 [Chloroflexota bacterium]